MAEKIVPVILVKNDCYWLPFALEASKNWFDKYVIYDIGSTDGTVDVIKWFIKSNPHKDFTVRFLPHIDPAIQGIFRNSMIAETQSDWYFILDADEIYDEESYELIANSPNLFENKPEKIYGVVRRIEVIASLQEAYGQDKIVPHHRIYHRTALFRGPHPGEYPAIKQEPANEIHIPQITCYHFHGCFRSPKDDEVPKRLDRRSKSTYRPGDLAPIDIFEKLPILKKPIADFPLNSQLKFLQERFK